SEQPAGGVYSRSVVIGAGRRHALLDRLYRARPAVPWHAGSCFRPARDGPAGGTLIVAVVATAMAPERVLPLLAFLLLLRIVQDYIVYPHLIRKAMNLHPMAVVIALWAGAALGGVVGVCLAIPVVGVLQVTLRHWREYRDIEALVEGTARRRATAGGRRSA